MKRIVSIGECMVELAPVGAGKQFSLSYAGDTLNTAWYLRRLLGSDCEVNYFSAVGTDALSNEMLNFFRQSGIGTEFILRRSGKGVGLYMIQLDAGERSFYYWRSDSAARTLAADPVALQAALCGVSLAYFSGITLAILPQEGRDNLLIALRRFRCGGGVVVFDPNLRPKLWTSFDEMRNMVMQAAGASDIVLPSYGDEAEWFGDDSPEATLRRYMGVEVQCCIVKNGSGQITACDGSQKIICDPIKDVTMVDTTAAGDSFNAGFVAARLIGAELFDAVQVGASLAAQVVTKRGALVDISPPSVLSGPR